MLNPLFNLNQKIFDKDVEKKAVREGFGEALEILGEQNPNVVVLTADLSESTKCLEFAKKNPNRFFECGVAEQNMIGIAAGLAVSGKIPFTTSYAAFSPGKNWETIRTTVIYNQANVKIAGHHTGIATGADGVTHQAIEDIALTRCFPNITIFTPCDSVQAYQVTLQAAKINRPVYIRLSRNKTPVITTENISLELEKPQIFWKNEAPAATIFSIGYMTYYALLAAKELEEEQIAVEVINVPTLKPIDEESIVQLVNKSGAVVTVEDHLVTGGLGSIIAEILAGKRPTKMEFIGLQNTFAESGEPEELLVKYQMDVPAIKNAVKKIINRRI